jgi:WD40 repeat protein
MSFLKNIFGDKRSARSIAKIPGLIAAGCCFIPDKNTVVVSLTGGELRLIDITQGAVVKTLEGKVAEPGHIVVSRNGAYIAVLDIPRGGGGDGKMVEVWDVEAGNMLLSLKLDNTAESIALSADGKKLAAGGRYQPNIDLYDVSTGEYSHKLVGHGYTLVRAPLENSVKDLDFSPDGRYLVSVADDGVAILWDLETNKGYKKMAHKYVAWKVCISHYGKTLASCGTEGWLEGEPACLVGVCGVTIEKAESSIFSIGTDYPGGGLAFSLDDKRILVADSEDTLWLWSGKSKAARIEFDFGEVLALSLDATRIAAEKDGTFKLWDISQLVE